MAIIPADKERSAVAMFRAVQDDPNDLAMQRIHAHIWPPRAAGAGGPGGYGGAGHGAQGHGAALGAGAARGGPTIVGAAPLSVPMLRTLLASISASSTAEEPGDDLPDDLEAAVDDLKESRAMVMEALRSGAGQAADVNPEGGGGAAPLLHMVLVRNALALVTVSKHRIEMQEHRERKAAAARARGARGGGAGSGYGGR